MTVKAICTPQYDPVAYPKELRTPALGSSRLDRDIEAFALPTNAVSFSAALGRYRGLQLT
jgi:hypothetical protein